MVDDRDRVLATASFATTRQGYGKMLAWMRSHGELSRVGVECTGSYGAGLLRSLQRAGIEVLEVTTPDRLDRRRKGKNDDLDAQNAAHAAFAGLRTVTPRSRGRHGRGPSRSEGLSQVRHRRTTGRLADDPGHDRLRPGCVAGPAPRDDADAAHPDAGRIRPDMSAYRDVEGACRIALRSLARRYVELHDEIAELDERIGAIVEDLAPDLVARCGIGRETAAQLLLTAGDNPSRLASEASFAALCGVSPVPASSGKRIRHRLNRGGDRAANSALHVITICRMRLDQRTRDYVARRMAMGHSKLEAIRMLKRYIAREVFGVIRASQQKIDRAPRPATRRIEGRP